MDFPLLYRFGDGRYEGLLQMTMDIYGHLFPNRNRGWVDQLDELRGGNPAQTQPAT